MTFPISPCFSGEATRSTYIFATSVANPDEHPTQHSMVGSPRGSNQPGGGDWRHLERSGLVGQVLECHVEIKEE